jgi:precorrin-8X/cobalt-precorrin-8 methylmutase
MTTLFDVYIFVDWSAVNRLTSATPRRDAIWVGHLTRSGGQGEQYCRTRYKAGVYVKSLLLRHAQNGMRVLVGFDFPYGYPSGFAQAIGLPPGSGWSEIWTELTTRIQDDLSNRSNRFTVAAELNRIAGNRGEGPFWGCPAGRAIPGLRPTSPGFSFSAAHEVELKRLRIVETRLTGVQEAWKLFGAGSVGSQALVGIPYICGLRFDGDLNDVSRVWPFETGFNESPSPEKGPFVLHAEIWPGVVRTETDQLIDADPSLIRDQAQVRAMCDWAVREDDQGTLGRFFARPVRLADREVESCIREEGWVLGSE